MKISPLPTALRAVMLSTLVAACAGDDSVAHDADIGEHMLAPVDAATTGTTRDAGRADADVDARAPDAASARDAAANDDAPATGCAAHAYALCEDFESAAVGSLPSGWSVATGWNAGTPAVTDAQHHGGGKALASAVAVNGQPRASRALGALGDVRAKHWGRVFYKVQAPAPRPDSGVIHNTLVGLKGSTEARVVDTVVNTQGKHQFLYNVPDDSCCTGSAYDYASYDGAWHCAEWYVDAATQSYRFFFEGTEVTSIGFSYGASQTRAHIEPFSAVVLGWINYQTPKTPYQAWFDDLAIDGARIGCDAASR